jgi:putative ABC transport system permease protein
VLCVVTAILFGLAPAVAAGRVDIQSITKEGGRSTRAGVFGRLRDALVILEVALAFVLATGAALVMREIIRLQHVPTGMATRNVLSVHITPRTTAANYSAIEQRVATIPGVHAAGFIQLTASELGLGRTFRSAIGRPTARCRPVRHVTPDTSPRAFPSSTAGVDLKIRKTRRP